MSRLQDFLPIAIDTEGRAVPKAFIESFDVGTNNPKPLYSDQGLTTPHANPLQADGAGRFFDVYLGSGGYKLRLTDQFGNEIWEQDNFYQQLDGTDLTNINNDIDAVEQQLSKTIYVGTDSGAANAYVLAATGEQEEPDAYSIGMIVAFKAQNGNTGASTVNINSLGNRNLLDEGGAALTTGFIDTTHYYFWIDNGSALIYLMRSGLIDTNYIQDAAVTAAKMATGAAVANIDNATLPLAKMEDGTADTYMGYNSSGVAAELTPPFRFSETPAVQAYTGGAAAYTFAHTLGVEPKLVTVTFECTSADANYAVGDRIDVSSVDINVNSRGFVIEKTTTNAIVRVGSAGVSLLNKTGFTGAAMAASKWDMEVTVYA